MRIQEIASALDEHIDTSAGSIQPWGDAQNLLPFPVPNHIGNHRVSVDSHALDAVSLTFCVLTRTVSGRFNARGAVRRIIGRPHVCRILYCPLLRLELQQHAAVCSICSDMVARCCTSTTERSWTCEHRNKHCDLSKVGAAPLRTLCAYAIVDADSLNWQELIRQCHCTIGFHNRWVLADCLVLDEYRGISGNVHRRQKGVQSSSERSSALLGPHSLYVTQLP